MINCRLTRMTSAFLVTTVFAGHVGAAEPQIVDLKTFFSGQLSGVGSEKDSQHENARTVKFSGLGSPIAGGIKLSYDVTFSDGERQHKVWTFLQSGPDRFVGHRADLVGVAQVTQNGKTIHMTYVASVPTKSGGAHNVSFDETFTQTRPGVIVNELKASYLFFTVATGEITLKKAGG